MSTTKRPVYRDRMACLDCRKAFRVRPACQWRSLEVRHGETPRVAVCPDCGKPMADMGADFMAPPRRNVRAWRALRICVDAGIRFDAPGSGASAPTTTGEAQEHVDAFRAQKPRKFRRD